MSPYRSLTAILCVTLISVSGIALPYPILAPLFIELGHPVSEFAGLPPKLLLGLVLAIYPLGILLGSNRIGAWSDRVGRRKVLQWTMAGSALGYVLSAWAIQQGSFLGFALSRLLTGVCEGNLSVARAIAADLHPHIDRTRAFSYLNATGYAGYLVGPLLGGLMLPLGASMAFWLAALACLAALVLITLLLPQDRPTGQFRGQTSLGLLKEAHLRPFFVLYLLLMLGLNGFYEFYPVWLVEFRGFDSLNIAYTTVLLTSSMILMAILGVMSVKRWLGVAGTALVGMAGFALALLLLPLSGDLYLLPFVLMGFGIALFNATLATYLAQHGGEQYGQGRLMGLMTTTFCLGNVLMALIGGVLILFDTRWVLALSSLLVLLAAGQFGYHHFHRDTWGAQRSLAS
ncbi:MFS transporter [Ferrimonas marina]|uniref:Predicted arabinose efflux permease, MFS family n=1 Tax=Ferrimonas marina TaxID=299255 RepID=A0A1M5Y0F4_9GAMM|nr:MFS transporter [Ferrimonas marina]SHI05288.1 Predicted arabinose efflux permease, MFS family [Ferrimonas marina]